VLDDENSSEVSNDNDDQSMSAIEDEPLRKKAARRVDSQISEENSADGEADMLEDFDEDG
jgi:hypothetical protein